MRLFILNVNYEAGAPKAIISGIGYAEGWFLNNEIHRDDGPAITFKDSERHWYRYDYFYNLNGPTIIKPSGKKYYHIDGVLTYIIDKDERVVFDDAWI